jgi:hypothetical protein
MPGAGPAQGPPDESCDAEILRLRCFGNAAGPNAGGADTDLLARAIDYGADALQIWIPAAATGVVRVADHVAERRPLAANLASHSHDNSSPILTKLNKVISLTEFRAMRTRFDPYTTSKNGTDSGRRRCQFRPEKHGTEWPLQIRLLLCAVDFVAAARFFVLAPCWSQLEAK